MYSILDIFLLTFLIKSSTKTSHLLYNGISRLVHSCIIFVGFFEN